MPQPNALRLTLFKFILALSALALMWLAANAAPTAAMPPGQQQPHPTQARNTPKPTDTPVPPPTDTPVPVVPTDTPVPIVPTDTPISSAPTDTPVSAAPTETLAPGVTPSPELATPDPGVSERMRLSVSSSPRVLDCNNRVLRFDIQIERKDPAEEFPADVYIDVSAPSHMTILGSGASSMRFGPPVYEGETYSVEFILDEGFGGAATAAGVVKSNYSNAVPINTHIRDCDYLAGVTIGGEPAVIVSVPPGEEVGESGSTVILPAGTVVNINGTEQTLTEPTIATPITEVIVGGETAEIVSLPPGATVRTEDGAVVLPAGTVIRINGQLVTLTEDTVVRPYFRERPRSLPATGESSDRPLLLLALVAFGIATAGLSLRRRLRSAASDRT